MKIGNRIKLFIQTCYKSNIFFAKRVEIDRTYLSKIINNKVSPGIDILSKFSLAGLSVDWLLNGNGSMFSSNAEGRKLKKKIIDLSDETKYETNNRAISWICENYDNLENFCKIFQLEFDKSYNIVYEMAMPDSEYLEIMNQAGCNIKWLHTGQGSRFENNPAGTILMIKNNDYPFFVKS
jgi:transcriptional regulator with XRE-family HTH domain